MPGRIYLTQNFICFYSALLGRTTKYSLAYSDIESIIKVNSKFSKSIKIVCKSSKTYKFSSFNDRDFTFKFVQRLWSNITGAGSGDWIIRRRSSLLFGSRQRWKSRQRRQRRTSRGEERGITRGRRAQTARERASAFIRHDQQSRPRGPHRSYAFASKPHAVHLDSGQFVAYPVLQPILGRWGTALALQVLRRAEREKSRTW